MTRMALIPPRSMACNDASSCSGDRPVAEPWHGVVNAAIRIVHNSIFNHGKVARTTSLHCNLAESIRKAGLGLIECRIRLEVLRNNGRQVVALQDTDPLAGGNSMIQHVYQSPMGCRFNIESASLSRKVWSQVLASLGALDF